MLDTRSKKRKPIEERKTSITDLSLDELSYIFIILVRSGGAAPLARMISVCRLFSQVGKRGDVLNALNLDEVVVSEGNYRNYQQVNSLISLAAEAGHTAAQCIFAKIIMLSCSKLIKPALRITRTFGYGPRKMVYRSGVDSELDNRQDQRFMSQLSLKSLRSGKGFYHYKFVKMFLGQCCPSEFKSMLFPLSCYKVYFRKDSNESLLSLRKMWVVCKRYGHAFFHMYGRQKKTKQELLAEFEELRFQALCDLDDIFMVEQ